MYKSAMCLYTNTTMQFTILKLTMSSYIILVVAPIESRDSVIEGKEMGRK